MTLEPNQEKDPSGHRRTKQASRRLPVWIEPRYAAKKHESVMKQRLEDAPRVDEIVEVLLEAKHTCVLAMVSRQQSYTLENVGAILSVSRERVRQIQTIALTAALEVAGDIEDWTEVLE